MEQLEIFATTPVFTNVQPGRPYVSATEVHERVLAALVNGIAIFSFLKADGETVRHAIGTLHEAIIPARIVTGYGKEQLGRTVLQLAMAGELLKEIKKPKALQDKANLDSLKKALPAILEEAEIAAKYVAKTVKPAKERVNSANTQTFFDLEEQKWKSYKIDNVLAFLSFPNEVLDVS